MCVLANNKGMENTENKNIKNNFSLMTCSEIAELLRVKVSTVYSWISYGQVPKNLYRKLGSKPIFIREEVMSWFLAGANLNL